MSKKRLLDEVKKTQNDSQKATSPKRKKVTLDLRIQSPTSLGYFGIEGIDTAPALIRLAKVKGIDVVAVTDFYSAEFVNRLMQAANGSGVAVIPGTALRARIGNCKDVILVCLFSEQNGADEIALFLHDLGVPSSAKGDREYIVERPFDEILAVLDQHQGLAIPSRMDKTPTQKSVIPTLVEDYGFRTFDLAYADSSEIFKTRWPEQKFTLISFSNAMALAQIGSRVARLPLSDTSFASISAFTQRELLQNQA